MTRTTKPTTQTSTAAIDPVDTTDDVDQLFRDAVAIRHLLDSLDPHDHRVRSDLLLARDDVRARAARMWAARGWRSITDGR